MLAVFDCLFNISGLTTVPVEPGLQSAGSYKVPAEDLERLIGDGILPDGHSMVGLIIYFIDKTEEASV